MAQVYKTIFQVRRATALEWVQVNPILRLAEPGFEVDTSKLKIGDGRTVWNDFPSVGNENYIYKAVAEHKIYQWDKSELRYIPISAFDEIELIHGGNANG